MDRLLLPARFQSELQRRSSVPPSDNKLTRGPSPTRYTSPIPLQRTVSNNLLRRATSPHSITTPSRRLSEPSIPQLAQAHQLAAETLLSMGPGPAPSASPETRTESSTSVPAPSGTGRVTPHTEDRGVKRKNEEEEAARARPGATLGLNGVDKDKPITRSPLNTHDKPAGLNPQRPGQNALLGGNNSGLLGSRYSIYGPTARDSLATSPWAALSQRYNSLGLRRDPPSTNTPTSKPASATPSSLDPPRRPSPDPSRDLTRVYPAGAAPGAPGTGMAGYGHYAMGRRELQEHREQLREGKKWLETMLVKTEKMLHMVENKMALAPNDVKHDDWEFEERERARQKEIERLEAERDRDRAEREKRERDRHLDRDRVDRERADRERVDRDRQEREHLSGGLGSFFAGRDRSLGALSRERGEAERNRDLLLASRRVSAVSPNGRERSTPGAPPASGPPGQNGSSTPASGSTAATGAAASGTQNGERKPGAWDGEPVMAGVALPRRDQGMRMGRGLWSFDVRG